FLIIDTGSEWNREELLSELKNLETNPEKINKVILTHNHFDHTGNINLFKKAKVYGSKEDFKSKKILDIELLNKEDFKIIKTPGHTKGGICILHKNVLFSGDTLFHRGVGRTDLPNSSPDEMADSLKKLEKIGYKILCPGHI
ncbi:MAG: MBL fold metallo-hydrolase, partial [Nanoarchaeota archaeon]|nr:MBL fold metallo-hydrolase [Nanoarchaeota archaeon]